MTTVGSWAKIAFVAFLRFTTSSGVGRLVLVCDVHIIGAGCYRLFFGFDDEQPWHRTGRVERAVWGWSKSNCWLGDWLRLLGLY